MFHSLLCCGCNTSNEAGRGGALDGCKTEESLTQSSIFFELPKAAAQVASELPQAETEVAAAGAGSTFVSEGSAEAAEDVVETNGGCTAVQSPKAQRLRKKDSSARFADADEEVLQEEALVDEEDEGDCDEDGEAATPCDEDGEAAYVSRKSRKSWTGTSKSSSSYRRQRHCETKKLQSRTISIATWIDSVTGSFSNEHTDTTLGDPLRGLSVQYLHKKLPYEMKLKRLSLDSNIYEIEPPIIRGKGAKVFCPRDGQMGAAYVDCVSGVTNAGKSTLMLSYAWFYKVRDIISTLHDFCEGKGLPLHATYVWICCFCINQHRVIEMREKHERVAFGDFQATFEHRCMEIGRIIAMVYPWKQPKYIERVWCIFELYTAVKQELQLEIAMPKSESNDFCNNICQGLGLDDMKKVLHEIDVRNAEATVQEDKRNILQLIKDTIGFHQLNAVVAECLVRWVMTTIQKHVDGIRFDHEVNRQEKVNAFLNAGNLQYKFGFIEGAKANYSSGLTLCDQFRTRQSPVGADLLLGMGQVEREQGNFQTQLELNMEAKEILRKTDKLATLRGAQLLWSMATYLKDHVGDLQKALEHYQEAKQIRETTGSMETPSGAFVLWGMADVARKRGNYEAALQGFRDVQQLLVKIDGMESAAGAWTLFSIANVKLQTGKLGEAYDGFLQAKRLRESMGTLYVMDGAVVLLGIAETQRRMEDFQESFKTFEAVEEIAAGKDLMEYHFFKMVLGEELLVIAKARVQEAAEEGEEEHEVPEERNPKGRFSLRHATTGAELSSRCISVRSIGSVEGDKDGTWEVHRDSWSRKLSDKLATPLATPF